MAVVLPNGRNAFVTSTGAPAVGYRLYTYVAGTSTPKDTYTTSAGSVANTNPVVMDARGEAAIYWNGTYDATLKDSSDVTIWGPERLVESASSQSVTDLIADLANTADAAKGDALVGVKTTVTGSVATTQHQVNEERASVFQLMTAAQIAAIAAETGTAAAICGVALQAGIDGLALNTLPRGLYQLDVPLRIKSGTSRTYMRGENRIRSALQPNAIDIKQAPANVNAMFIVQDNNAHFGLENLYLRSSVAYTGVAIYCQEGGGADASGQCLFSGLFKNLWVAFSSQNTGFLTGGIQNCTFDTVTCEFMKGVFNLVGVGNGDCHIRNFSLFQCYDSFMLQTADTNGSFNMSVSGVHAYNHLRGRLFDVKNWVGANISDVLFEADAANLGDTGLFRFQDCAGLQISDFYCRSRSGVPECAVGIEIKGSSAKFSNGTIEADVGLLISSTGAVDLEFENVDFTGCTTAAFRITAAATGTIRTRGCKFNNGQGSLVLSTVNSALRWYSYDDEFLNSGFAGAGSRNITWSSDNEAVLTHPRIGQNDAGALAAYFVLNSGTGAVELVDPIWVGTAPTARTNGVVNIRLTQVDGVVAVTATPYVVLAGDRDLTVNFAGITTLTLPAATSNKARRFNLRTITANTVISNAANVVPRAGGAAGTAILAATAGNWAELVSDGTAWQIMAGS